ncbi:DUF7683 domain-containing protein [Paremcibacter congregatus]|uniref:DUF7683 domain-containing protein n=1 Tax=Paremcibacter congregatus TaxID=2043170 RepID=A0A2G4YR46_9PROT|nr:hypothetical protein [Paremcibacter congregatus]PHZ84767.1 hypothetical protein CRD36_10815 [Paremcibacter congregatus]QDE28959.1 hypothetical protein FIV45_17580 [Paremcibacter congregatus]
MQQYCITKYDKSKRDKNGTYPDDCDQWTESCDVGRHINGKKVQLRDYFRVEDRYIKAALALFDYADLPYLRLTNAHLHDYQMEILRKKNKHFHELSFSSIDFREDAIICRDEIPTVLKMIFRNLGEAKLEFQGKFFIHIGWDFYMYIGAHVSNNSLIEKIEEDGLYVLEWDSPYTPQKMNELELFIDRSSKETNLYDDSFRIEINVKELHSLRDLWGYSKEHPFLGVWEIKSDHAEGLKPFVSHAFDFDKFRYWLHTDGWED